ncbi:MAG: MoaD/ThiS family protein [Planctomycetaceae bacterium]
MSIAVQISSGLKEFSGCPGEIHLPVSSVAEALSVLQRKYPNLYRSICDETGRVRRHVNLFVNSDPAPLCPRDKPDAALHAGDILTIWQAVSGG